MLSRSIFFSCQNEWMNVINDDDEEKKNANGWFHNGVQDHQSWSHNWKKKSMFSFWPTCLWLSFKVFTFVLLSCRDDGLSHHFLFRRVGFWLNNAVEGTTNIASVLGGYLSLFVIWEIDFLPPTTLMKPLRGVPLGIHLVLITLGYLIWSLFKQEWMLGFASGVCLRMGPFLLVFVFKVKAWLMPLISATLFLSSLCLNHFIRLLKK